MKGIIFDIKEFSIHDGPGGRITVFMKGCPLRCRWCHNPEGLVPQLQIMYKETLCVHCNRCREECSHEDCAKFGRCIHVCPNNCLSIAGKEVESTNLSEMLLKNEDILKITGGGITFSGGEPLMQSDFVMEVADIIGDRLHKAIQTSGYATHDVYKNVVGKFDFVMQDIKLADREKHMEYTGVYNDIILENIWWLKNSGKDFVLRVPLIPGITDTEENLLQISKIAGDCPVELLRYNPLAGAKYPMLGLEYRLGSEKNREEDFVKYFKNAKME